MDFKDKIISELEIIRNAENLSGNVFKVRAYNKVLDQLRRIPEIRNMNDITAADVKGIGKSIEQKIKDIIETGELNIPEDTKATVTAYEELSAVHGIGHVKALELIEAGVRSVESLRKYDQDNPDALNAVQKKGLRFHDDITKRIPRKEMLKHEALLLKVFTEASFTATIAGSFRRQMPSSGDIDLLITPAVPTEDPVKKFHDIVKALSDKYIHAILALGDKKCMAVVKLPQYKTYRRLDILLTSPGEYPYALLYFTGSQNFNIGFRTEALKHGYTINEHGMVPLKSKPGKKKVATAAAATPAQVPDMKTEIDIFNFLGITYVEPQNRI